MQALTTIYPLIAELVFDYMVVWFIIALIKRRNDVADIAWGLGFLLVAIFSLFYSGTNSVRAYLVTILVSVWSIRLATHIYRRNHSRGEDSRYLAWRQAWGKSFYWRTFLQVFLLQGLFLLMVVSPVVVINTLSRTALGWFDVVGILIWVVGFYFESVGDAQLAKHVSNPENKGKLLTSGLWQYSRHPNYFGEVLQWWGIGIICLAVTNGWVGLLGPMTITFLILKVSGVPMLEKKMELNPGFATYKNRTSVFVPWFPKKSI